MSDLASRMIACWKRLDPTEADDDPVAVIEASHLLAEASDVIENLQHEHDAILRGRLPTHHCKVCGALWIRFTDSWSLFSRRCGPCCDNAAMGDQIERLPEP